MTDMIVLEFGTECLVPDAASCNLSEDWLIKAINTVTRLSQQGVLSKRLVFIPGNVFLVRTQLNNDLDIP